MTATFLDSLHADPWAEQFVDLASLNASASDAIERSIGKTRTVARSEPQALRSSSLVVLGPPGAGKTHLFSRLRRRLGPRAVFVHLRPLVHMEITPRFVLGEVVKQLGYVTHGASGVPQAHTLVGSLLAHLRGKGVFFPNTFLAECEALSDAEREERLDTAVEQVLGIWQEADESYLRRLLQVPLAKSDAMQRALLAWLSGRDCDVTQLQRIGATASLGEEMALSALRTLSAVASLGAPIVLVFDQLENFVDAEGPGARLLAYANLTAELVDSMRARAQGARYGMESRHRARVEPIATLSSVDGQGNPELTLKPSWRCFWALSMATADCGAATLHVRSCPILTDSIATYSRSVPNLALVSCPGQTSWQSAPGTTSIALNRSRSTIWVPIALKSPLVWLATRKTTCAHS